MEIPVNMARDLICADTVSIITDIPNLLVGRQLDHGDSLTLTNITLRFDRSTNE